MKYLSFILAISVLLLLVIPCCFEDKCFSIHTETQNTGDDTSNACDDCSDNNYSCCSPFLHCNTCTGFPEARFYHPITIVLGLVSDCNSDYVFKGDVPGFISLIWQPPQA